ncbi:GNAT family N-acetyltransferase [Sphingobacterium psychroaquaticum]|uniref:Acetyltransferase (GNAT) family protein n=1 Tax=Sphingobacterium psychroaquaticum TaxID=561061 RepID=A0A1X7KMU6_9SPHI|nr:GNAT family N-acetyltransferase [Sphingobacterium psychroaquaticum]SMG42503.1 Acetyltransferase (GNAT) family protein [Sphingobacterium psychroaquaticum]
MITCRPAKASDAKAIAPIMLLAMEDIIYYFIDNFDKEEATSLLTHFASLPNNQYSYQHIIVAEEEGQILGQLCLYPGGQLEALRKPIFDYIKEKYNRVLPLENETQEGEIYIDTIAVLPEAQGKGIGKKLLQYAIETFVEQQGETLGLLVDKENPSAKKLYLNMGFAVIKQVDIFGKEMDHLQYLP